MKHYFKWSVHIIIGLIVVIIIGLLWKIEEQLPENIRIIPLTATSSNEQPK